MSSPATPSSTSADEQEPACELIRGLHPHGSAGDGPGRGDRIREGEYALRLPTEPVGACERGQPDLLLMSPPGRRDHARVRGQHLPTLEGARLQGRAHPRARGRPLGTRAPRSWAVWTTPPRVVGSAVVPRGRRLLRGHVLPVDGDTPASAGTTRRARRPATTETDHPRERGDDQTHQHAVQVRHGTTPVSAGTTPASAGTTTGSASSTGSGSDHPRERGDYGDGKYLLVYGLGPPPRGRGRPNTTRGMSLNPGPSPRPGGRHLLTRDYV